MRLATVDVSAKSIKVHIVYHNDSQGTASYQCNGFSDPELTYLYYGNGRVPASDTFCHDNPTFRTTLAPGENIESWAVYPNRLQPGDQPISLNWYNFGNARDITLVPQ